MLVPPTRSPAGLPTEVGLLFVVASIAASCSGAAEEVRRHTYAQSFRYLDDEQIRTAMGRLGGQVVELDRALRGERTADDAGWSGVSPGPIDPTDRDRVVAILDRMIRTANRLEAHALATNHPELSEGLDAFKEDLSAARRAAALDPPRHFLAGSITGACLYCHGR